MQQQFEDIKRKRVKALDGILGKPFKVLDDGFVRVVDYMGSDASIVQAARVSYGRGTTRVHEDRGLIRYLMRHRHTSPFEMCEITLHVRVPMDCWRQWIRHRTANVNEYSTRYSIAIDSAQTTKADGWRMQSKSNYQGSIGFSDPKSGKILTRRERELQKLARQVYDERIKSGVAREQARKDLPLSTYTEAYWKIDLNNLLHFLELRMDPDAQYEIRCYAETIGTRIVQPWCPMTWDAFMDYWFRSITFSSGELELLKAIASGDSKEAVRAAKKFGWVTRVEGKLKRNFERSEFEEKLKKMGLAVPWE